MAAISEDAGVDLRQLTYFAAVVRHRHVTRAAEELYVSQPAVSQQVARLERELGVALLRRGPAGVEPTPAGEELLRHAEAILASVAEARAAMDAHAGMARGVVRVGTTAGEAPGLAGALAAFHAEHPGVQIALRQASAPELLRLLSSGALDVAVAALGGADVPAGVTTDALTPDTLVLAVPEDDPLAARPAAATADLRGRPLILGERGSALRETVMAACAAAGFSPVPLFEVGDPATVRSLVHAGIGLSVVPARWLEQPGPPVAGVTLDGGALAIVPALLTPSTGATPPARLLAGALGATLRNPA